MLDDSLIKIYNLERILRESEQTDIPVYSAIVVISKTLEEIILYGTQKFAESFYQGIKVNLDNVIKSEEEGEITNRVLGHCREILGIKL